MAAGLTRTVLQIRLEQKLNSQSDLTGRFSQEIKGSTHTISYKVAEIMKRKNCFEALPEYQTSKGEVVMWV